MIRKRLVFISFIALLVIGAIMVANATASSETTVYVSPPSIWDPAMVQGTQFTVDIVVENVEDLWAYQFWLSFNPRVIHGVNVETGPFLGSAGGEVVVAPGPGFDNEKGELKLFGAAIHFEAEVPENLLPSGGGVLATVTFEVVGYGNSPITLGPETALANKTGGHDFDGEWCFGWHQVEVMPGQYETVPYDPWVNRLGHGSFDNRPSLYVDPSQVRGVRPGKDFTVSVNVVNITDLYQWEFYLSWNATLLNVTGVYDGGFLGDQPEGTSFVYRIDRDLGYVGVNCTTIGEHPGVSGDGTIANVTFKALERGVSNLILYNTSIFDSTGNPLNVRTADSFFINLRFHNIAVTDVTPYPNRVEEGSGEPMFIDVTLANMGDYNETGIDVTAYYGEDEICTERDLSLDVGAEETLTFMWNTTGVSRGKYIIRVNVSPLAGEAVTADNTKSGGQVTISSHDIAITSVRTPIHLAYLGYNVKVTVVVKNKGTELETFNVTAYYDGEEIGTQTVANLGYLASQTLEFIWDTTGCDLSEYTISARAAVVEGEEEEDTADNTGVKEGTVSIVALEETAWPTEFVVLPIIAVVVVGATIIFRRIRKKEKEGFQRSAI